MFMKTPEEIQHMRVAGRMAAAVLEMIEPYVQPGVSTGQLDRLCHHIIVNTFKANPSTLHHHGFPASICTSINHVVCHGIPSDDKILKKGDIVNIDVTVKKEGFIGDTSKMYCVGEVSPFAKRLVDVTQECLYIGIRLVRPGTFIGDIGHAIQKHAEKNRYSVVREYGGHGIGREMWEDPQILHYGSPGTGMQLFPGLTFTIEPMINMGTRDIRQLGDGWTVITKDRKLSAQWEHTILVTEYGYEVLTRRPGEMI
jgi:methionyl aminopeptidase